MASLLIAEPKGTAPGVELLEYSEVLVAGGPKGSAPSMESVLGFDFGFRFEFGFGLGFCFSFLPNAQWLQDRKVSRRSRSIFLFLEPHRRHLGCRTARSDASHGRCTVGNSAHTNNALNEQRLAYITRNTPDRRSTKGRIVHRCCVLC